MRSVRVSPELCGYLRAAAYLPADLRQVVQDCLPDCGQTSTILVAAGIAERFRGCFTERLARTGFDREYRPSPEGVILEDLIDRFAG